MLISTFAHFYHHFLRRTTVVLPALFTLLSFAPAQADRLLAAHLPPVMIEGNAETPGYAIELVQAAAERIGRSIDVEFYPVQRAFYMLKHNADVMFPSFIRLATREDQYQWIAELQKVRLRFISHTTPVLTLGDARKVPTISVSRGSITDIVLTERGFTNLVRVHSSEAAALMLETDRTSIWLTSKEVATAQIEKGALGDDIVIGPPVLNLPTYVAASLGVPAEVVAAYRTAFDALRAEGEVDTMAAKYGVILD